MTNLWKYCEFPFRFSFEQGVKHEFEFCWIRLTGLGKFYANFCRIPANDCELRSILCELEWLDEMNANENFAFPLGYSFRYRRGRRQIKIRFIYSFSFWSMIVFTLSSHNYGSILIEIHLSVGSHRNIRSNFISSSQSCSIDFVANTLKDLDLDLYLYLYSLSLCACFVFRWSSAVRPHRTTMDVINRRYFRSEYKFLLFANIKRIYVNENCTFLNVRQLKNKTFTVRISMWNEQRNWEWLHAFVLCH